jgi:hypothetical protein
MCGLSTVMWNLNLRFVLVPPHGECNLSTIIIFSEIAAQSFTQVRQVIVKDEYQIKQLLVSITGTGVIMVVMVVSDDIILA